jgi:hypothetical protein
MLLRVIDFFPLRRSGEGDIELSIGDLQGLFGVGRIYIFEAVTAGKGAGYPGRAQCSDINR